jgi:hypothetical protein
MKKIIISFVCLFGALQISNAQIDDIFKKIPGVGDMFEGAVTTSIKDAYPSAYWLEDLDKQMNLNQDVDFSLNPPPGYYRYNFKTFCLHAGTYAPTEGAGYLVAPLKGAKSELISNILGRYYEHPEIEQKDVQLLIWGIEAGQKFSNYPADFQYRVTPLLKPEEIALMEVDVKEIAFDLLPKEVQDIIYLYRDMRGKLSDATSTYEDVEKLAVKTGIAPVGKGSKNISSGVWTSVGDGVYVRCFPHTYSQSEVEIYIPKKSTVEKDGSGRITAVKYDNYNVELSYDGTDKTFKTAKITNTNTSEENTFENNITDYTSINKETDDYLSLIKKSLGGKKYGKIRKDDLQSITGLKKTGLTLQSIFESQSVSNPEAKSLLIDAVNGYVSMAEGKTRKSTGGKTGIGALNGLVFAPANTSMQRLGSSGGDGGKKKKKDCKPTVKISKINSDYLPVPGTTVNVTIDIKIEGEEGCKTEAVKFRLYDVTRERGRYMNDKDPAWYDTRRDLYFDAGSNSGLTVSADSTTAESSSEVTNVTVSCNDYGAYGKLEAMVKVDGTWYTAKDESSGNEYITIPVDDNNNKIADKWEADNSVSGNAASWDEEADPSGQGTDGDGMTNYEEYRGFMCATKHGESPQYLRMNPKIKEMFVIDNDNLLPKTPWQLASEIRVYYLSQNEVYGSLSGGDIEIKYRWVDFNAGYSAGSKYAVNIIKAPGLADPYNQYPWPSTALAYADPQGCKSPRYCKRVVVFPERVKFGLKQLRDTLDYLVKKDTSQSTISFNGNTLNKTDVNELISFLSNTGTFDLFLSYQMTLSMIHEIGHSIGLPHHTGSKQMWSGAEFCPMRYIDINDQIKWVAFLKTVSNVDDFTQWEFCKSPDNCWSKISVNDNK